MSNTELLPSLGLWVDPEAHVLICCHTECGYALCVDDSNVTTHLKKHDIPLEARKGLTKLVKSLRLCNPDKASPRADGSPEHTCLKLYSGFSCRLCRFRTASLQLAKRHYSDAGPMNKDCPYNRATGNQRNVDDHIDYVYLQSWGNGSSREFWTVIQSGTCIRPAGGEDAQDHFRTIQQRE